MHRSGSKRCLANVISHGFNAEAHISKSLRAKCFYRGFFSILTWRWFCGKCMLNAFSFSSIKKISAIMLSMSDTQPSICLSLQTAKIRVLKCSHSNVEQV